MAQAPATDSPRWRTGRRPETSSEAVSSTAIDPARLAPAAAGSRKLLQGIVSSNAPVGSGRRRYFGLETPQVLMPRIA